MGMIEVSSLDLAGIKQLLDGLGVEWPDECVVWTGKRTEGGYGLIPFDGKESFIHRASYRTFKGEVSPGMHVDHQCHTPNCWNPKHLQEATPAANYDNRRRRANQNTGKLQCLRGHVYTAETCYQNPRTGKRYCKVCRRERYQPRPQRMFCKRGHPLSGENVRLRPTQRGSWSWTARVCRECERIRNRAARERRRAA